MRRAALLLLLASGCVGIVDDGGVDAGMSADASVDTDAGGAPDAGEATDAGATDAGASDAGTSDAGPTTDAGGLPDAGGSDAGSATDAGSTTDAGTLQLARFTASDAGAPDPERGFFRFVDELTVLTASELNSVYADGHRLVYTQLRLDDVRATSIGATRLAAVATGLGRLRTAGLKAVLRVTYNYPQTETEYQNAQDATLAQVQAHVQELAPVLAANADVIAFFQAGFIGAWGEWHTSSNNLTTSANKLAVRDALLTHFPASRTISFRYPPDLRAWYPAIPSVDERLDGGAPRVGFHNDCFMASPTDVGTYPSSNGAVVRQHMQDLGKVAPFGGETCNPADDPNPMPRLGCANILAEGAAYGLTYLNLDYWVTFHDSWRTGGCFEQVQRSMGHRLSLVELELPTRATAGATVPVRVTLANSGWARVHNPRPLVLWLRLGTVTHRVEVQGVDVRRVGAGEALRLQGTATLPSTVAAGSWAVDLALPDAAPSIAADARYATRLFNADATALGQRWNGTTGRFETGLTLVVP